MVPSSTPILTPAPFSLLHLTPFTPAMAQLKLKSDAAEVWSRHGQGMEAISELQATLTTKIEEVRVDISLVRQDLHKVKEGVKTSKTRIGEVEGAIHSEVT